MKIVLGVPKPGGRAVRNNCDEVKREAERPQRAGRRNSARSSAKRMEAEKREPPLTKSDLSLSLYVGCSGAFTSGMPAAFGSSNQFGRLGDLRASREWKRKGESHRPARVRYLVPVSRPEARFAIGDGKYGFPASPLQIGARFVAGIAWKFGRVHQGKRCLCWLQVTGGRLHVCLQI